MENNNKVQFSAGGFGIIFDEQKRVLLVHRRDYDLWNLPGGVLELGEAPWEGAIREIKEETGFDAEIIRLINVSHKPQKNDLIFTFLCKIISGQATLSDESDKIEFFEINKIPHNTVPNQVQRIKDFLENPEKVILKTQTGKSSIDLVKEGKL